jgi:hypothetical protein
MACTSIPPNSGAIVEPAMIVAGFLQRQDAEGQRSARFNLHLAVTRARRAVTIMTPQTSPCPALAVGPAKTLISDLAQIANQI